MVLPRLVSVWFACLRDAVNVINYFIDFMFSFVETQDEKVISKRIILRQVQYMGFQYPSVESFVAIYTGRVTLKYIQRASVQLFYIAEDVAFFIEVPDDIDVHSSQAATPFVSTNQYYYAVRVLEVPLNLFYKATQLVDTPTCPVLMLFGTGRCGSTIVAQMFEKIDKMAVISQHSAFYSMSAKVERDRANDGNEITKTAMFKSELEATLKWVCRPMIQAGGQGPPLAILIKMASMNLCLMKSVLELDIPWVRNLFLYRNGLDTCKSFVKMMHEILSPLKTWEDKMALLTYFHPTKHELLFSPVTSQLVYRCMVWASYIQSYSECRGACMPVSAINYKDIITEPEGMVGAIMNNIGLTCTNQMAEDAAKALVRDSHQNISYSRAALLKLGDLPELKYTSERRRACDCICDTLLVPRLESNIKLPGTLEAY